MDLPRASWPIVAGGTAVGLALVISGVVLIWQDAVRRRRAAWEQGRRQEQERASARSREQARERVPVAASVEPVVPGVEQVGMDQPAAVVEPAAPAGAEIVATVDDTPEPAPVAGKPGREVQALLFAVEAAEYEATVPTFAEVKPAATVVRPRRRRWRMEQLLLWPEAEQVASEGA